MVRQKSIENVLIYTVNCLHPCSLRNGKWFHDSAVSFLYFIGLLRSGDCNYFNFENIDQYFIFKYSVSFYIIIKGLLEDNLNLVFICYEQKVIGLSKRLEYSIQRIYKQYFTAGVSKLRLETPAVVGLLLLLL